jgi:hypothetical protein
VAQQLAGWKFFRKARALATLGTILAILMKFFMFNRFIFSATWADQDLAPFILLGGC